MQTPFVAHSRKRRSRIGRFHDPARPFPHPQDVDIALDIDRYDFAVRVNFENSDQSLASKRLQQ
jgi:hypothetical protein